MKILVKASAVIALVLSSSSHAALHERLGGLAYYDDVADLSWLANANPAVGSAYDTSFPGTGNMNWSDATAYVNGLNIAGTTGWRLPTILQPDASCDHQSYLVDLGYYSYGYECTGSELGNLFHNVLGGIAEQLITTTHNANYDLFSNIQTSLHWSSTEQRTDSVWSYYFGNGYTTSDYKDYSLVVWPVHSGDVGLIDISDVDGDGVVEDIDNCPTVANADQADIDEDSIGDACDADNDNDGVYDVADNCPLIANAGQENTDFDDEGDACDVDDDNDNILDTSDNCPLTSNTDQSNTDGHGSGDACNNQLDQDDDEFEDAYDNCPTMANANQLDFDQDGLGDSCDSDQDNDGVVNVSDVCMNTPAFEINNANGCTIEQLCPCDAPRQSSQGWLNQGQYVSCVTQSASDFFKDGLIDQTVSGRITNEAAASNCGDKK